MVNRLKNQVERSDAMEDIVAAGAELRYLEAEAQRASADFGMSRFADKLDEIRGSASRWKDALGFQLTSIMGNPYNENKVQEACTAINEMCSDMIDLADALPDQLTSFKKEIKEIAMRIASTCSLG
jgi:hypothetical protein